MVYVPSSFHNDPPILISVSNSPFGPGVIWAIVTTFPFGELTRIVTSDPRIFVIPEIILASIMSIICEHIAVMTMWFGNWYEFYIVQKETDTVCDSHQETTEKDNHPRARSLGIGEFRQAFFLTNYVPRAHKLIPTIYVSQNIGYLSCKLS